MHSFVNGLMQIGF